MIFSTLKHNQTVGGLLGLKIKHNQMVGGLLGLKTVRYFGKVAIIMSKMQNSDADSQYPTHSG